MKTIATQTQTQTQEEPAPAVAAVAHVTDMIVEGLSADLIDDLMCEADFGYGVIDACHLPPQTLVLLVPLRTPQPQPQQPRPRAQEGNIAGTGTGGTGSVRLRSRSRPFR